MADYEKLYVELYCAVNEALQQLMQGNHLEAIVCLLEGQVHTIKQIFTEIES